MKNQNRCCEMHRTADPVIMNLPHTLRLIQVHILPCPIMLAKQVSASTAESLGFILSPNAQRSSIFQSCLQQIDLNHATLSKS
jgi:hypothetical protein